MLGAVRDFLHSVTKSYPMMFEEPRTYGAAHAASGVIDRIGKILKGDNELRSVQQLSKEPLFHRR